MKTKKNKKFYNFTEKQKRRDVKYRISSWRGLGIPKYFRKMCNKEDAAKNKKALFRIVNGLNAEFVPRRRWAGWWYW